MLNSVERETSLNTKIRNMVMPFFALACLNISGVNADILSTTPENYSPVSVPSVTIKVPNDPGILRTTKEGMIRDLGTLDKWDSFYRDNVQVNYAVRSEDANESEFTVHARVSNGTTGSGVKYSVGFKVAENGMGAYSVTYTPLNRGTYQQGLFGKFSVPNFTDNDLMSYLRSGGLRYKFEVNTPYPTDSVFANFERLANPRDFQYGQTDPVTGKIFKKRFQIPYGASQINFTLEAYPYRNGSKAVVYTIVPATETAPGEVDYAVILSDVKHILEKIAQD